MTGPRPAARSEYRHRPRGWLRHYAGLAGPAGMQAARLAFERDGAQRLRLLGTSAVRRGTRRIASRPSMRSLVALPGARFRWRDVPAPPPPGPLAATVRPLAIATCDMDRPLVLGATPLPLPLQLGHECVAEVVGVGERVAGFRPGDRVVVPFQVSCGGCVPCRSGRPGSCAGVPPLSMYGFGMAGGPWGGALADLLAVPYADAMLVPLPPGLEPAAAASVCDNVADGYKHVAAHLPALLAADPDAEVLVVGGVGRHPVYTASVPLYTCLAALALGARNVHLVDSRPGVRAHAERIGVGTLRPDQARRRRPAPLVADVSSSPAGLALALNQTGPDGVCSSIGGLHRSARLPMMLSYARNLTFHMGRTPSRRLIPPVLELMASGRLRPETVTTRVARLDDAPAALTEHLAESAVKTIFIA
ncbi:MAG: zinc-binding dehydrogenase [Mycobacteriales bacterium]